MDGGSERIGAAVTSRAHKSAKCNRIKFQLSPRKGSRGRQVIEKDDLTIDDSVHASPNHPLATLSDASREDRHGQIQNLVEVLKALGNQGLTSVREELEQLEAEQSELKQSLDEMASRREPADIAADATRRFVESLGGISDLVAKATDEERATLVQHLVEVIELRPDEGDTSKGLYALGVRACEKNNGGKDLRKNGYQANGESDLTVSPLVRRVDEKAPRDAPSW
jgi:hypothetical protein